MYVKPNTGLGKVRIARQAEAVRQAEIDAANRKAANVEAMRKVAGK